MDRLVSMAVFKHSVDVGSFAAAARHFGISPEMVGNHVRALEKHLGVRLLNRSTRRLNLTEAGGVYYERCAQILADIQNAEAEMNLLQASPSGLLRVTAPVTFGVLHLAPAVSEYMTRYPDVKLDMTVTDRLVNLIEEGFDVAIRIGELQDSKLIVRQLASDRDVVCAAPAYLDRAGRPVTPSDLTRHACLVYTEAGAPATWRFKDEQGRTETVHVSGPVTTTNPAFLHHLALAGHGVVCGPSFIFCRDIADGRLVPLLTNWQSRELSIHALYAHRPLLSAKVRTFVDFLAERFGSAPGREKGHVKSDTLLR